ncbi:MAG TPA: DUF4384 domain-containing protein [Longimicrobiales bacterium]|nr:DUF4384 domain-containing protein [Longimicrobiales bacterium]
MIVPLFVPLVLAVGPTGIAVSEAPDPPVQVWFDQDGNYDQGDRVRVFARALRDGYMVILHADLDGRVRVLFPLDPVQDDFVRGGQTLEILGRGDDGAFAIVRPEGYGTVLAAWSPDPFYREGLVRGDHWDYRVIAPDGVGDDPEAGLLDIVHVMAGGQPFEYHTAQYLVGYATHTTRSPSYSIGLRSNVCIGCSSHGWYDRSGFSVSFSIGNPSWSVWYGSGPWYRPRYRPVHHYYDPWRYVYVVPVYRPVYWYDPWYDPWWSWRPVRHRSGVSVGIRYAGCWSDCGPRWGRPYRPGRATGVTFGDAYWRQAGGSAGGATGVAWGGTRNAQGQGIARGTAPTRYAVPKDSDAGRGTGTAQPSRIGETRNVVTSTPPSRTRGVTDDPVRGSARDDQRIRQQAQPSRAPVVTSTPQNTGVQRPDRNAVVRSGTQATPSRSESGAVRRGIGQSNADTRIVPEARTSNGLSTRSPERSTAIRRQALPAGSTTSPPATSRSGATTRSGIATRSANPDTRVVPSTRASDVVAPPARTRSSSGVSSRTVPSTSQAPSRAVPSRGSSGAARAVPRSSTPTRVSPPARSSGGASARAVPRSSAPTRVSPPARSSGGAAARAGSSAGSGSSSRAAPTRSSGASRSGGVAARAGSSRGSASGAGGAARSRSGGSGG